MVLVEPDLFFRQLPFHTHKLVLHRATMRAFEERLRTPASPPCTSRRRRDGTTRRPARRGARGQRRHRGHRLRRRRRLARARPAPGLPPRPASTLTVAGDAELPDHPRGDRARPSTACKQPRMQHFYERQRRRLDLLMDGDRPVGGRWSYDTENRKKLPEGHRGARRCRGPRAPTTSARPSPGCARSSPTTRATCRRTTGRPPTGRRETWLTRFLEDRFADFGPYEDAIAADEPWLFHSVISPLINIGLLDPRHVVERAVRARRGARRRPAQRGGLRASGDRLAGVHAGVVRRPRPRHAHPQPARPDPRARPGLVGRHAPAWTRWTP